MSVFDQTTDQAAPVVPSDPNQGSFISQLVASKGEQWSNPEVIAKGKVEADQHITLLEQQLSDMREDLARQDYSKTLLETLQNPQAQASPPEPAENNGDKPTTVTPVDSESLESLVTNVLQKREQTATATANIDIVEKALSDAFGTEANATVQAKANELGISLESMKDLASQSPNAFLTLVGSPPVTQGGSAPKSTVNSAAAFNTSNERNYDYYRNLRKTNPSHYYSPATQRAMLEDRQRLGQAGFGA